MKLSKPSEDPEGEPDIPENDPDREEMVVRIDGEMMPITEAVERHASNIDNIFGILDSLSDETRKQGQNRKQAEAIKELQEAVEELARAAGHDGQFLDEDKTL
jgi:hypothetical protein